MEFEVPVLGSAIWWQEMVADKKSAKMSLFDFMYFQSSFPLYQAMDLTNKTYESVI